MAHIVSLTLRSLQRYLLIIYNSRRSRKCCHWPSSYHTWINGNRTQSLYPIDFILTSCSSISLSRILILATLHFSLPFNTMIHTFINRSSWWLNNTFSAISSISSIFRFDPLRSKNVLLLQQLLLRQLLTALIFKDIGRNGSYKTA